jgi:multiple sugar transport system substrate-binding protein
MQKFLILGSSTLVFVAILAYAYITGDQANNGIITTAPTTDVVKRVKLTYWDLPQWRGLSGSRLEKDAAYDIWPKRMIAEYEAMHPEVQIDFVQIPWAEETNKYLLAANAGEAPDVYFRDGAAVNDLAHRGLLNPIDEYITPEDRADWYPIAKDAVSSSGQLYGFPFYVSFNGIAINMDLVKERHAEHLLPKAPNYDDWNYAQFTELAKALTFTRKDGSKVNGYITHGIGSPHLYFMWMVMNGSGGFYDKDHTKAQVNTPYHLETWQFLTDLIYKYGVSPKNSSGISFDELWKMYINQQVGMMSGGMWMISSAEAQAPKPFNMICVQPPHGSFPQVQSQDAYVGAYIVSKRKDQTPERIRYAMDFAKFITNSRNSVYVVGNATLAARRSSGNPYYGDPRYSTFFSLLQNMKLFNPEWKFEDMPGTVLLPDQYFQEMIAGKRPVGEVLKQMQHDQEQLLAQELKAGYPKRYPRSPDIIQEVKEASKVK